MDSASEPVRVPKPEMEKEARWADDPAHAYDVICWDDPVNYMDVETHVFMKIFGWDKPTAVQHTNEILDTGKSVLVREAFEQAECHVHQLLHYSLHATMEPVQ